MGRTKKIDDALNLITKQMDEVVADFIIKYMNEMRKISNLAKQILNDVEEVHHFAIMAGDIQYMQKLGTILERYKEVRKNDIGG